MRERDRERYLKAQARRKHAQRSRIAKLCRPDPLSKHYTPKDPTQAELSYMAASGFPWIPNEMKKKFRPLPPQMSQLLREWVQESCCVNDLAKARVSELFEDYEEWCNGRGVAPSFGLKSFAQEIRLGFKVTLTGGKSFVRGIMPQKWIQG